MKELSFNDIEWVYGAGFASAIGFALGFASGMGAKNMQAVESQGNLLLNAMQFGA